MNAPEYRPRGPLVAGYDGHDPGRDAVALSLPLARVLGGSIVATHVSEGPHPFDSSRSDQRRALRERLGSMSEAARATLARADMDLPVTVREVSSHSAARGLHDLASAEGARLIVLGSTHHGPLGRVAVGTTGARLLIKAPCPVAIAPKGFATALFPTWRAWPSPGRLSGLRERSARRCRSRSHWREGSSRSRSFGGARGACARAALPERILERVESMLERTGAQRIERVVFEGAPASQLRRAAEGFDLLILGCRDSGGLLGHPSVGSVSREPHASAAAPVIVVPERTERSMCLSIAG